MPPENYNPNQTITIPQGPLSYLKVDELPLYAPMVTIDPSLAQALIQRASLMISTRYNRTGEIQKIFREILSLHGNGGHLMFTPIITIASTNPSGNDILDTSQGDEVDVRYAASVYPYTAYFGAPDWQAIDDLNSVDISASTGEIMVASGLFPSYYGEVRVTYRSGYCPIGGPYPEWLKQGCGMLIENIINRSGSTMWQKGQVADQQSVQFFDNSFFNAEVDKLLSPLKVWSWR